jgi:hypothetical protein
VHEAHALPEVAGRERPIKHLPEDVERFYRDALRVMDAGVPDAAAVQLRRTLEATASNKHIDKRTLFASVKEMIDQGLVTRDFAEVLTHVRTLGNIGAHASDETLSQGQVERALSFTTQFLRNVYEVPGELQELRDEASDEPNEDA